MPASYYVYPQRRVAIITWESGLPDLSTWRAVLDAVLSDPAFSEDFGVVSDWRTAVEPPTPTFVHGAVTYAGGRARAARLRWASVLPPQLSMIEAGSTAEALSGTLGVDYRAFTEFRDAVAWAGRSDTPAA